MTYKFEQFKVEIINPQVVIESVNDNLSQKTCSVSIKLITPNASFGIDFSGFTYSETWEDADIQAWVSNELVKYEA